MYFCACTEMLVTLICTCKYNFLDSKLNYLAFKKLQNIESVQINILASLILKTFSDLITKPAKCIFNFTIALENVLNNIDISTIVIKMSIIVLKLYPKASDKATGFIITML